MTTALDWVEEARSYLLSGYQEGINRLSGALNTIQTSLVVEFDQQGITRGTVISIDLEEMLVWSVSANTVTVQRGYNGSTIASHLDQSLIHVKPKFSSFRIFRALNDSLREISGPGKGMFQVREQSVTFNAAIQGYDFPGEVLSIIDVRYEEPSSLRSASRVEAWDFVRDQPVALYPSGQGLLLYEGGYPGRRVNVQYRAQFAPLTSLTENVLDTGIPATAIDIPPLGAIVKLVPPRDVKRSFTESQGEARKQSEVPPGSSRQAASGPAAIYAGRIRDEAQKLQSRYPFVKS